MNNIYDYGKVISSMDTISKVSGLLNVFSGEMVYDNNNNYGMVLSLTKNFVSVVSFNYVGFSYGNSVFRTFKSLSIVANPVLMGNVFTSTGLFINRLNLNDYKFPLNVVKKLGSMSILSEIKAPGIIARQPVYEPLYTGFMGVDGLLPLGRGQRELIIGDRQTGKTSLAIDAVLNSSNYDMLCLKFFDY